MNACIVCGETNGVLTLMTEKGKKSVKECAKLRENENVLARSENDRDIYIHKECQKKFTDKRSIGKEKRK